MSIYHYVCIAMGIQSVFLSCLASLCWLNVNMTDTSLALLNLVNCAFQAHLDGKSSTLFSSGTTSNNGCITIEVLGNFLESCVSGLNVEEVHDRKFDSEPAAVENVVLPPNVIECNRVDVGVEEESNIDTEEHDCHALGTDVVWQNFDSVTDKET